MDDTPTPADQKHSTQDTHTRRDAYIGWAIIGVILAIALIAFTTVGFGPYDETATGARAPTLWEWLQLIIVPLALAFGALWFNKTQKDTELNIAEKATTADREIAEARQRQATLEAYYDRMTELLLMHNLREAEEGSEVRSIARARTVAVVRSLDSKRNQQLFAFLRTSKLIETVTPVVDLSGTDLSRADLRGVDLSRVNLSGANLNRTKLCEADLGGTVLRQAHLCKADMREAFLFKADLTEADLTRAKLSGADLREANLSKANPGIADLSLADLRETNLSEASLVWANLFLADLGRADLSYADLSGAQNLTFEQLEKAKSLAAAFMPDEVKLQGPDNPGPTFEEWKVQYLAENLGTIIDKRDERLS